MNITILWLNPKTGIHTYGIHVLSYSESDETLSNLERELESESWNS